MRDYNEKKIDECTAIGIFIATLFAACIIGGLLN